MKTNILLIIFTNFSSFFFSVIFIVALCFAAIAVATADRPKCNSINDFTKKWPHSEDNKFWFCILWKPVAFSCRKNTVFDFGKQKCISPVSICDIPCSDDSRTLWPSHNENAFYMCPEGQLPVEMNCPSVLKFSAEQENCVWPEDWTNSC